MVKKKSAPNKRPDKPKWIPTPGLKHILEEEVPLAAKLLKDKKVRWHILVRGQTRTGKSQIRNEIQGLSNLDKIGKLEGLINCAAFSPDLLANELFGHVKEAFTDAKKEKKGLLEDTSDPPKVIFLEEIGELPQPLQAKFLVFLETGTFLPVGGTFENDKGSSDEKKSTMRIVATTNVEDEDLRKDFLARFWEVRVPPIHERREDIPVFLEHFLKGDEAKLLPEEWFYLMTYNWPGGVSEIEKICIKIKYYLFGKKKAERHDFVKGLLKIAAHDTYYNYREFCNLSEDLRNDKAMNKLFPHFNLSFRRSEKPIKDFDYETLINEWKVWCDFFNQNPKSPSNVCEEILSPFKEKIYYRKNPYNFLLDSESFLFDNNPIYKCYLELFSAQGLKNKKGVRLLNSLHNIAMSYRNRKSQRERGKSSKTEGQISFENTTPKVYKNLFWEYQVQQDFKEADIRKKYRLETSIATINRELDYARERLNS